MRQSIIFKWHKSAECPAGKLYRKIFTSIKKCLEKFFPFKSCGISIETELIK